MVACASAGALLAGPHHGAYLGAPLAYGHGAYLGGHHALAAPLAYGHHGLAAPLAYGHHGIAAPLAYAPAHHAPLAYAGAHHVPAAYNYGYSVLTPSAKVTHHVSSGHLAAPLVAHGYGGHHAGLVGHGHGLGLVGGLHAPLLAGHGHLGHFKA